MNSDRTARSATRCLRRFIGRTATPASLPSDEAGIFQRQAVQGWGQAQMHRRLCLSADERRGSGHNAVAERLLEIEFTDKGAKVFSFSFG